MQEGSSTPQFSIPNSSNNAIGGRSIANSRGVGTSRPAYGGRSGGVGRAGRAGAAWGIFRDGGENRAFTGHLVSATRGFIRAIMLGKKKWSALVQQVLCILHCYSLLPHYRVTACFIFVWPCCCYEEKRGEERYPHSECLISLKLFFCRIRGLLLL